MIGAMSIFDTLRTEIRDARAADYELVHIRVTTDALRGSAVAVPITAERARTYGLDFDVRAGRTVGRRLQPLVEVLIHPEDWRDLLVETDDRGVHVVEPTGDVRRVFGVRVREP